MKYIPDLRTSSISILKTIEKTFVATSLTNKLVFLAVVAGFAIGIFLIWDNRQYAQCSKLLSKESHIGTLLELELGKREDIVNRIKYCYKRVYGVELSTRTPGFTPDPAPLKPDKEVYYIGEKITYGYLTLQVKELKKVGLDLTTLDVYVYNSKDNPRDIYIRGGQFFLETPDKIRISPVQTTFDDGRHLKPDEGDNGTIYFNNYSIQKSDLLKMTPFEGSPSLVIDLKPELTLRGEWELKPEQSSEEIEQPLGYVRVLNTPTGFLRVREKPSITSREIARIKPGETYPILKEDKEWYKIKSKESSGFEGWVPKVYSEKLQ